MISSETVRPARIARGIVAVYSAGELYTSRHEQIGRAELARRLAALKKFDFVGDYTPGIASKCPVYLLPADTLVSEEAQALGIRSSAQLFGGVAPHRFV